MPTAFDDLSAKADGLFNDHHTAGSIAFNKTGKVGSGGATYEFKSSNSVSGGPIEWNCEVSAGNFSVNHDHAGNITKSLDFEIKQVPGLKVNWSPAFNQASGLNLGDVKLNYDHELANLNVSMAIAKPDNADFDLTVAPLKCCKASHFGIKGNLGASGLSNAQLGFSSSCNGVDMAFKSNDLSNPMQGTGSLYKALPDNKNFCCYGVEATTDGSLALAAASGCCSTGFRYKLDNSGKFSVARVSKINQAVSMTMAAELNMTNMGAGGHNFGMSFNFA